jgi:outer membrane lipoprotein SlyB
MKILLIALLLTAVMMSGCVESDPLAGTTYEGPEGNTPIL